MLGAFRTGHGLKAYGLRCASAEERMPRKRAWWRWPESWHRFAPSPVGDGDVDEPSARLDSTNRGCISRAQHIP